MSQGRGGKCIEVGTGKSDVGPDGGVTPPMVVGWIAGAGIASGVGLANGALSSIRRVPHELTRMVIGVHKGRFLNHCLKLGLFGDRIEP